MARHPDIHTMQRFGPNEAYADGWNMAEQWLAGDDDVNLNPPKSWPAHLRKAWEKGWADAEAHAYPDDDEWTEAERAASYPDPGDYGYIDNPADLAIHKAAEADDKLAEAYQALLALKGGYDRMHEIPAQAMPTYRQIGAAMGAVGKAREHAYQLRMMIQRGRY